MNRTDLPAVSVGQRNTDGRGGRPNILHLSQRPAEAEDGLCPILFVTTSLGSVALMFGVGAETLAG
jgi:hypothetical protein